MQGQHICREKCREVAKLMLGAEDFTLPAHLQAPRNTVNLSIAPNHRWEDLNRGFRLAVETEEQWNESNEL